YSTRRLRVDCDAPRKVRGRADTLREETAPSADHHAERDGGCEEVPRALVVAEEPFGEMGAGLGSREAAEYTLSAVYEGTKRRRIGYELEVPPRGARLGCHRAKEERAAGEQVEFSVEHIAPPRFVEEDD